MAPDEEVSLPSFDISDIEGVVDLAAEETSAPVVAGTGSTTGVEMIKDVELNVKIELGRANMTVSEILKLGTGAVVELDKLAGDPVDILVNEQLVARGEVLVLNDNFCVRINEIIPGMSERVIVE
jgi:flagellar motor switch protein FliN/FliY